MSHVTLILFDTPNSCFDATHFWVVVTVLWVCFYFRVPILHTIQFNSSPNLSAILCNNYGLWSITEQRDSSVYSQLEGTWWGSEGPLSSQGYCRHSGQGWFCCTNTFPTCTNYGITFRKWLWPHCHIWRVGSCKLSGWSPTRVICDGVWKQLVAFHIRKCGFTSNYEM